MCAFIDVHLFFDRSLYSPPLAFALVCFPPATFLPPAPNIASDPLLIPPAPRPFRSPSPPLPGPQVRALVICLRLALNLRRLTAASDLAARENLRAAVYQQVLPPARRFGWFGSTSPGRPCAVAEDGGKDVELDAVWCQVRDTAVSRGRAFASSSQPSLLVSGDKEGGHAASVRTRCDGGSISASLVEGTAGLDWAPDPASVSSDRATAIPCGSARKSSKAIPSRRLFCPCFDRLDGLCRLQGRDPSPPRRLQGQPPGRLVDDPTPTRPEGRCIWSLPLQGSCWPRAWPPVAVSVGKPRGPRL